MNIRSISFCVIFLSCFLNTTLIGQTIINNDTPLNVLQDYVAQGDTIREPLKIAFAHQQIAETYIYQNRGQDSVIDHYLKGIHYFWKGTDTLSYYKSLIDLGRYYESINYVNEAKSIFEQIQSIYITAEDTLGQMLILSELTDVALVQNNIKAALDYLAKIKLLESTFPDSLISEISNFTFSNINKSGDNKSIITDSLELQLEKLKDTLNRPNYISTLLLNNGIYFLASKKYPLAVHYLTRALETAGTNADRKKEAFKALASCYQNSGDFKNAYDYLNKYTFLNDSVFNVRRLALLEGLTVKNAELDQKQQSIEMERDLNIAEFKNRINNLAFYGLIFAALIILVVSYLIIRNYQERLNTNQIISKQKEEITKRRITDLENNLKIETMHSMITGQEAERERIAKDLHDSLGGLLSTVKLHFDAVQTKNQKISKLNEYQRANMLLDEACKEVRNISNNMQPGALLKLGIVAAINDLVNRLQSGGKPIIDFQHFGLNGDLDNTIRLNIYRIIQELLYNSIKHAQSEEILVQLIQKDDELIVLVEDDGVGFDSQEIDKGMGTENIASRVNYLKGDLSVHSVKGTGTTTMINIPLSVS